MIKLSLRLDGGPGAGKASVMPLGKANLKVLREFAFLGTLWFVSSCLSHDEYSFSFAA